MKVLTTKCPLSSEPCLIRHGLLQVLLQGLLGLLQVLLQVLLGFFQVLLQGLLGLLQVLLQVLLGFLQVLLQGLLGPPPGPTPGPPPVSSLTSAEGVCESTDSEGSCCCIYTPLPRISLIIFCVVFGYLRHKTMFFSCIDNPKIMAKS